MMASSYNAKEEDGHHSGASSGTGLSKNKKPDNTAFKQQRLPAWQPILTAGSVLPAFFVIGLIFIPIGIGLYVTSNNIKEFEIDYTGVSSDSPCYNCAKNFTWNTTEPCVCTVNFTLLQPFESNVFMYYGLSNFYQNHRRYVKSRDDRQLNGDLSALTDPSKECEPYRKSGDVSIAPCGAIANSLFNDTLVLYYVDSNNSKIEVPLVKKGIAWWTDKHVKFRNPAGNSNLTLAFQDTAKPVNWAKPVYELDPSDPDNNGFINEDFIVWMRTAALPTFRKLYRIIQKKSGTTPTLPNGNYMLNITYNYPVLSFDGRKRMILSTISWMGGKNPFLGIAYITVGSICFFLGVVLLIIHHKYDNRNTSADIPS
ncbi:cell cycle control protein 50A-like [Simochromis diagramma]|uniref:cell cycle control protein 50A-like n=1 Tax=Simochromis diagramma TaxID=43689 RepID=UPI001A7EF389|nr:cell cycle control protein 50A-like [Simochromis diagramma]